MIAALPTQPADSTFFGPSSPISKVEATLEAQSRKQPDLESLVGLFYQQANELGQFEPVPATDVPKAYRDLLNHDHHMTVTVEKFHNASVKVQVLGVKEVDDRYCRKILLATEPPNSQVVQFGIVRLNLAVLESNVREQIEAQRTPLGRVLITNDVLRRVELSQLFRVTCGEDLSFVLRAHAHEVTYGRTAMIFCNDEPAVELLEIVAPTPSA